MSSTKEADSVVAIAARSTARSQQKIILAAGTYDGVVAGWVLDLDHHSPVSTSNDNKLKLVMASPIHGGSVRSLTVSKNNNLMLSTGYDECLKTHDFAKGFMSSGEIRTPADFGTPVCSAFAPPDQNCTHCLVGFGAAASSSESSVESSGGKLVIYKKRDWSIQHVLVGHEGGVGAISVHPTGKLAVTGGLSDGKLKVWDLERGRLAYSNAIAATNRSAAQQGRKRHEAIVSIVWSAAGDFYGFSHGSHVTVREVATGKDILDVDLPSRTNQICLLEGSHGLFVAAACNDGSLPVLAVESCDDESERRAIMAIEPVDGPVAAEERYKCIQTVTGYYVATANSAGVVSLMDLEGAVNMIMSNNPNNGTDGGVGGEEAPVHTESDTDEDGDEDVELAVDIIDSVQLGTGARITCLAAWTSVAVSNNTAAPAGNESTEQALPNVKEKEETTATESSSKRDNRNSSPREVVMDSAALEKARALVSKAKKIQKRKSKKKHKLGQRI